MDRQVRYLSAQHGDSPCNKGAPVDESDEVTVQRSWITQIPWLLVRVRVMVIPTITIVGGHHEDVGNGLCVPVYDVPMDALVFSVREEGRLCIL